MDAAKTTWTKTENHIYNKEIVICDVYVKPITRGFVYLMDEDNFTFTVSCGRDSDRSFTGCFFGDSEIKTVHDAMTALDKRTL